MTATRPRLTANLHAWRLWLVAMLLCLWAGHVHASLHVSANDTTLTLNTATFFRSQNVAYQRKGLLIKLPLKLNACAFQPLNSSAPLIKQAVVEAAKSPDTGILIPWRMARDAGCASIAELANASLAISAAVEKEGFPPVSYLAIMSNSSHLINDWGPGTASSAGVPALDPTTKRGLAIALVDQWDTKRLYDAIGDRDHFQFDAQGDAGIWNDTFRMRGYGIFQWICFGLIVTSAVGALARALWFMVRGAYFYGDSRTILLLVSVVAAIAFAVSAVSIGVVLPTRAELLLRAVAFCLSCCAFSLLCWYWSYRVTEHISSKVLVAFRAFLGLLPIVSLATLILHGISDDRLDSRGVVGDLSLSTSAILAYYVTMAEIPITTAGSACFGVWFLICSFKKHLAKLSKQHAVELALLCVSQAILFGMSTAVNATNGVNSVGLRYGTVQGALYESIITMLIITVHIVVACWAPPVPLKCHELADDDFTAQLVIAGPKRSSMVSIWKPSLEKRRSAAFDPYARHGASPKLNHV
ncbi:hypothetical protein SYNPS1DRAFT_27687 [Syncephalis pseudoplumigaleata]|uniref:G-protein coupled receptors family 3 profile domain-containing protein n=1 Tax=Syncephalis pseudoplumigaleata TaxID=1712513 RepID=A0A4P9Z286_9FUNG|nr:hypothetical protein SYNPS1DRAFT_27687 [Syncephalis pseudoplumigaleata]|eukprot:RKP26637.1 hypothetical protein SYNPS1DRAFT_27687 [Syncephalis pseudoplumigaleata]